MSPAKPFLSRKRGGLYECVRFLPRSDENRFGAGTEKLATVRRKKAAWIVERPGHEVQTFPTLRDCAAYLGAAL
jgi:hypothetical protein